MLRRHAKTQYAHATSSRLRRSSGRASLDGKSNNSFLRNIVYERTSCFRCCGSCRRAHRRSFCAYFLGETPPPSRVSSPHFIGICLPCAKSSINKRENIASAHTRTPAEDLVKQGSGGSTPCNLHIPSANTFLCPYKWRSRGTLGRNSNRFYRRGRPKSSCIFCPNRICVGRSRYQPCIRKLQILSIIHFKTVAIQHVTCGARHSIPCNFSLPAIGNRGSRWNRWLRNPCSQKLLL